MNRRSFLSVTFSRSCARAGGCTSATWRLPNAASWRRAGRSPEPFFGQVFDRLFDPDPELVWDVPDQLAANYLKLRGLALAKSGDVSGAVAVLRQAQEKGAKVKTVLDDLLKKVP